MHGSEAQQRVVEAVARQDRERCVGRQAVVDHVLAKPAHAVDGLRIGKPAPRAVLAAFGKQGALRRFLRLFEQYVGDPVRVGRQFHLLLDIDDAVIRFPRRDLRLPEIGRAIGGRTRFAALFLHDAHSLPPGTCTRTRARRDKTAPAFPFLPVSA